jgi:putative hemolysin
MESVMSAIKTGSALGKPELEARLYFQDYKPSCNFNLKVRKYSITVAQNVDECMDVFRLRHAIFLDNDNFDSGLVEFDFFDMQADHLILRDDECDVIIGTYRILSSDRTTCFYSQTEFEMGFINQLPGLMLEVGRACIHPDYRRGPALQLVWQGLGAYFKIRRPEWLFGCSSTHPHSQYEKDIINSYLLGKHCSDDSKRSYSLNPVQTAFRALSEQEEKDAEAILPTLLKYYLRLGGMTTGEACWDPEFQTLDYLTLMHVPSIPHKYAVKFNLI